MLRSLHIRNYVLIDSLDIKFPEGLVIITGQTGAGKSILLGALGLLAGERASAEIIGQGGESCVVEGEFETHRQAVPALPAGPLRRQRKGARRVQGALEGPRSLQERA